MISLENVSASRRRQSLPLHAREQAAIIEFAYDAVIGCTRSGDVTLWNAGAARLFGYSAAEMEGQSIAVLTDQSQADEHRDLLREACAGQHAGPIETTRRHRTGALIPVELVLAPVKDEHGQVVMLAATIRDISARRRLESLRGIMVEELKHRIVNTMATVRALATQSLRGATSLDTFATTFSGRLHALMNTHDMLTQNAWLGATLNNLVKAELAPYDSPDARKWSVVGDDIPLDARQAVAFSMVLHELTTNAMKYGALSADGGHIAISWRMLDVEGISRLHLTWTESGGPPVVKPARTGVGSRLLTNALAAELDGTVALLYEPAGFRCEIDVPLDLSVLDL